MNVAQMTGSTETPDSTEVEVLEKDGAGMVLLARGTDAPTDAEAGYAKGCIFIDTDVAGGTSGLYENIGTTASCEFSVFGSSPGPDSVDTAQLVDGAVTNDKIEDATIGGEKINNDITTAGPKGFVTYRAVYDFAVDGGAQGAITLADSDTLPDNLVCASFMYDVVEQFTSATDAATVTFGVPTDGNFMDAVAISDVTNAWDVGPHLVDTNPVKTTAARAINVTVAGGEDLTGGKAIFTVFGVISE
jgi:hypothetical protein